MLTRLKMDNRNEWCRTSRALVSGRVCQQVGEQAQLVWHHPKDHVYGAISLPAYRQIYFRVELIILDSIREPV